MTGNYYQVFKSLNIQLFCELSKDHNAYGEDMNEFHAKYNEFLVLITQLDLKVTPSQPAWGSIFDGIFEDLKHWHNAEKVANIKDKLSVQEITVTLDEIPDPPKTSPCASKDQTRDEGWNTNNPIESAFRVFWLGVSKPYAK